MGGYRMEKRQDQSTDELFLLESLDRLRTPEQRYLFTVIADALSLGLASSPPLLNHSRAASMSVQPSQNDSSASIALRRTKSRHLGHRLSP